MGRDRESDARTCVPVTGAKEEVAAIEIDSNRHELGRLNVNGNINVNRNVNGYAKGNVNGNRGNGKLTTVTQAGSQASSTSTNTSISSHPCALSMSWAGCLPYASSSCFKMPHPSSTCLILPRAACSCCCCSSPLWQIIVLATQITAKWS